MNVEAPVYKHRRTRASKHRNRPILEAAMVPNQARTVQLPSLTDIPFTPGCQILGGSPAFAQARASISASGPAWRALL